MKNILNILLIVGAVVFLSSCELEEIKNPNAPTYGSFIENPTQADARLLATGLEAVMRNDIGFHYQTVSIMGREYYDLTGVDPRYTGELLKGPLDNNGFLTTRSFAAWYKIVQTANLLMQSAELASPDFTQEQENSYFGYAKTLKAYALLMVANRQYTNGIRLEVSDPDNLGPLVTYSVALEGIMDLLNEAYNELQNSPGQFDFPLSSGFTGFNTPETFAEFNRAIAARVAIYQGNKALARTLLNDSFLDLNGDLDEGPAHIFGGRVGNDLPNPLFYIQDQSGQEYMVHDSWLADAEPGDNRVTTKSDPYAGGPVTFDNLTATNQVNLYSSNTDPVPIIRNEELILLWAEANIGFDNAEAEDALNVVRNAAGIGDYTGATTDDALVDELLQQRRYSLFGEGHRWIDLRRYDRLDEIPTDRAGDNVLEAFPTPVTENETL
ncbi:hypothetical protein C900_02507 [Fulvivirga imtechensis AK7]|uniref:RagB/SusD domain-containing protein n=1 Tax=Fulvivirga imtechensis AK7 TaxID=1237149 RepID=L8JWK0_9BACT|nr:RagB/SusD family nutrient uptake outer membrane protein [Fulvivirga imtechensis]ELR71592.1 hypothetical protein C900_02507 [Fulvivirga imtechensis AK7]